MSVFAFKIVTESNVFEPDADVALHMTTDLETGDIRSNDAAAWIRDVGALELLPHVPFAVRQSFAFARGGFAYAYWYHPLLTTVVHEMLRIADFATVEACRQRDLKMRTMSRRIAALASVRAIPAADENAWRTLRETRDRVTHPTSWTTYGYATAYRLLRTVRDLINRIDWIAPDERAPTTE